MFKLFLFKYRQKVFIGAGEMTVQEAFEAYNCNSFKRDFNNGNNKLIIVTKALNFCIDEKFQSIIIT